MLQDKIKSLREAVGKDYTRPSTEKLNELKKGLADSKDAMGYLTVERGLSQDTIKHFQLGYNTNNNSISIPIFKNGVLINIKYRFLKPEKIKYISERGAETWIYNEDGIQRGLKSGAVLIVEGEFDLMSAWQRGIKNVISPASGKDSYGVWLELLDNIPKIYIAYDNDEGGKSTAIKIAERLGLEKSFEIKYPEGTKDANDYFKVHTREDFLGLVKEANPYYTYQFKGLGDIINNLRNKNDDAVKLDLIPKVEIEKDWLLMVSGKSNVGKTSYVLNIADQLSMQKIPTLILPFERGIESVGKRFLQIKFNKSIEDLKFLDTSEWNDLTEQCLDVPIYFSLPKKTEIVDTIIKARRLFDTRFVIIDHLDYVVRHASQNKESEIADTLQTLKRVAEEHSIVMVLVTHIRKIETAGSSALKKKPNIEDLKGSASLYQDPECVIMLNENGETGLSVDVVKNKGEMVSKLFEFNPKTGKLSDIGDDF